MEAGAVYGADSDLRSVKACCVEGRLATANSDTTKSPVLPERDCAFCTLAATLVEPLEQLHLPLPDRARDITLARISDTPLAAGVPQAAPVRGPPACGLNRV
jgi:hypothetical protein